MFRLIIPFLFFLFTCSTSSAISKENTIVKVGIYNNKPLIFVDKEGQGVGLFADIIEYVAAQEGWQIEYLPGNWKQSLARLDNNEIDLLSTVAFSEERDRFYDFSKEFLLTNWGQLYTPIGSEIKAITDVAGKKVAVLKGDIHHTVFTQALKQFGIECEIIETDDYLKVLGLVSKNKVDAGIVNRFFGTEHGAAFKVKKSGVIFNPIKIHYAVLEGKNRELLITIDRYIKDLKDDGDSPYYLSLKRWFEVVQPRDILPAWLQWAGGIILALLGTLFVGNLVLRAGVKTKTRELTFELNHRRQIENKLQEALSIINRSPAVAFLWRNMEGWPVEFVSDNVVGLFGYTAEDFSSGQISYAETVHHEDLERVSAEVAASSDNREATTVSHLPYRIISRDGSIRWLDDRTFIRRDQEGKVTHYEGIVVDITDSVLAAESLRESNEKLARSKKMESLGFLAGGVAHDLNNVLSGIVSYPDLLLLELSENCQCRTTVEAIKESGERAVAIVQDLLTVARGVATVKAPLSLNEVITSYVTSPECDKLKHFHPGVEIKNSLDPDLLNISGSSVHIRKLVMNLVSNASESIEGSGSVTISTYNHYVDTSLERYGDKIVGEYAVLTVSDDGSGITSEVIERIFEPFYTKKVMGRSGTGLGLAVVWNVVQDHQGYVDVTSDERGTRFTLYFPSTREKLSAKDLPVPLKDLRGRGENILIVDDVSSQRDITCKMLEYFGYEAVAVASGEEAIEYLAKRSIELVVLDMVMDPGINGRETYERIVKIHPAQKSIIVSGYAVTDDVKGAQKLGAGKFIRKPLTLEKLGLAVKEELEK